MTELPQSFPEFPQAGSNRLLLGQCLMRFSAFGDAKPAMPRDQILARSHSPLDPLLCQAQ